MRKVPPGTDRGDVAQDALRLAVQRYAEGFRDGWLAKRVWGDMKDLYGREWKRHYNHAALRERAEQAPPPAYVMPDQSVQLDVQEALDKLDPAEQDCVEQCDMLGRSQHEVAAELRVPLSRVRNHLSTAREKLRGLLGSYA